MYRCFQVVLGRQEALTLLAQELLGLERVLVVAEQVLVFVGVGERLGRLLVLLGQLVAPQLDYVRYLTWQIGASEEGRLRQTVRVNQQLQAVLESEIQQFIAFWLVSEKTQKCC